jgi:small subunit ribosomal protein S23
MHNAHVGGKKMSRREAYDQARKEFYNLRHEEDVERMVAKEEAMATGAYFGKSRLEIGMDLEDKEFESWKEWAVHETAMMEQMKSAAYTGLDPEADDEKPVAAGGRAVAAV